MMGEKMNMKPDLVKLTRLWQKRLNLTHWNIAVRYHRTHEHRNVAGRCTFVQQTLEARISVLDPIDWTDDTFVQDIEQIVVHELLHLWFCPVQPDSAAREDVCFEQAINTVASALVTQHRAGVKARSRA